MDVKITPTNLKGNINIPPSKSLSHRAIIAACLSNGKSKISNVIMSKDIIATIEAMESLGAKVLVNGNELIIEGCKPKRIKNQINCKESGSTVRFMIPIALTTEGQVTFNGENHLVNRPLNVFLDLFDEFNIKYEKGITELPLTVYDMIKPGVYNVRGDISSQFITGLLYALPMLNGDSVINVTTNLESVGYIDLTLDVLEKFGIEIINNEYKSFIIKGNQEYKARDYYVEGDYSQSAFWLVAGALGGNINLCGMSKDSKQGDKEILDIIRKMNVDYKFDDIIRVNKSDTIGTIIDLSQAPDLGPAITVLAALSKGQTQIINASRLRIKECDRITSMVTELNKLGANIIETKDGMIIEGVPYLNGGVVQAWNDHRVAMSLAMASIKCKGELIIEGAQCVSKSYPHFFEDFKKAGGKYE